MRTRSQGPPEPVRPSTRRPRGRQPAPVQSFSDDDVGSDHEAAPAGGAETSSQSRSRGRSCPPISRRGSFPNADSPPSSPVSAARQLFGQPTLPPQRLLQPAVVPMAAKYSKFRGKSGEDPDAHTRKFEKTYGINNAPPVVPLHMESTFESTLSGKASKWLAEFPEDHFLTYDARSK